MVPCYFRPEGTSLVEVQGARRLLAIPASELAGTFGFPVLDVVTAGNLALTGIGAL